MTGCAKIGILLRAYKLQIIWLFFFICLQIILFGLGVWHYFAILPSLGGFFMLSSMVAFGTAQMLYVNCGVLLFLPAFRWTTGLLRRTFVAKFVPFDSWIGFHVILGFVVGIVVIGHVVSFVLTFCKLEFKFVQMIPTQ